MRGHFLGRADRSSLMHGVAAIATAAIVTPASAQTHIFHVPAQSASQSIPTFAQQAGVQILASGNVGSMRTNRVEGNYSTDDALRLLLTGTGLTAERTGTAGIITITATAPGGDLAGGAPAADNSADVLVTGTRIHGAAPTGSPLVVVGRKQIEDSGRATVAEYIQTIPQNYSGGENEGSYRNNPYTSDNIAFGSSVNLRGLGTESTLVLFDGVRPALGGSVGAFVDTSLIPAGAIDRIEILTDGASAIYGTDAVAGVVNVRFRTRYQGAETRFYSGVAAGGDMHELQASQTYGRTWNSGSLLLAYQFDHRSRLAGDSRPASTEDLTRWGGPDNRGDFSAPGTLFAADGSIFGIPAGQDGRNLSPSDLLRGQANRSDRDETVDLLPQQTVHSAYAAFDQKLVGPVSIYARALYAHRAYDAYSGLSGYTPRTVPVTNPFYVDPTGTGEPVSVAYDFSHEVGRPAIRGRIAALTTVAGIDAGWGGWSFDLSGTYGHQKTNDDDMNNVSSGRVATALADTDPATALNLFGNGTGNNPATIAFIRLSSPHRVVRVDS